jgi:hypothetical protein
MGRSLRLLSLHLNKTALDEIVVVKLGFGSVIDGRHFLDGGKR